MRTKDAERRLEKARCLAAASEVCLLDLGGAPNWPTMPAELEELVLVQGPRIFTWLIDRCGGKMAAEQIADVSHSTMSRWVNSQPGQVFGQRKDRRAYRSIWFGYPSPFPGFDRIIEEIHDEDTNFLRLCVEKHGLSIALHHLRSDHGFGLEMLDLDQGAVIDACDAVQIPPATRRRWMCGVLYPKQWRALDALCDHVVGLSWLETVLRVRPITLPRRVAKEALLCLIEESWEMR